jgi:hypothetical protein
MKTRHVFLLVTLALTLSLLFVGQAASKPGPLSRDQIQSLGQSSTPDLIERYVERQPASAYYTPAALKAYGLRMQAMGRTYEGLSATTSSSDDFDIRDALIGAAGGIVIAICVAGLFVAASRSRRPQVAL